MPIIGSHMSIAGGYWKAVESAAKIQCDCVQLFTKNNNQWRAKPISEAEAADFQQSLGKFGISHPLSHASYLINLASPNPDLRLRSIEALVIELERAAILGIPNVVVHPGSFTTGSVELGIEAIIESVQSVLNSTAELSTRILLENVAGQGTNIGADFSELARIIDELGDPRRVGVCLDTCHAFAAGYNLAATAGYESMIEEFDQTIGLESLHAIHLNDSKKPLGSRVDRHEHVGRGAIGLVGFQHLLNDPRLNHLPMYLETEKGVDDSGVDWDVINLAAIRSCVK